MHRPNSNQSINRGRPQGRSLAALLIVMLLSVASITACIRNEDLTLEQREHQLETEIMCPVCDGETLDQSQSQTAQDMKQVIRDKLAAGQTNQEIKDYFVESYRTEEILAAPRARGFNLVVWIMPGVIALGGAAIVFFAFRGMRRPAGAASTAVVDRNLAPYLEQIDHDLGLGSGSKGGKADG